MDPVIIFPRLKNEIIVNEYPQIRALIMYLKYSKFDNVEAIENEIYHVLDCNGGQSDADFIERICRCIAYAYGIYFEIFGYTDKEICKNEVERQLKMRISPLFIEVKNSFLDNAIESDSEIWCLGCGYSKQGIMIINPYNNEYVEICYNKIEGKIPMFQLNLPGLSKPMYIKDGFSRMKRTLQNLKERRCGDEKCHITG